MATRVQISCVERKIKAEGAKLVENTLRKCSRILSVHISGKWFPRTISEYIRPPQEKQQINGINSWFHLPWPIEPPKLWYIWVLVQQCLHLDVQELPEALLDSPSVPSMLSAAAYWRSYKIYFWNITSITFDFHTQSPVKYQIFENNFVRFESPFSCCPIWVQY